MTHQSVSLKSMQDASETKRLTSLESDRNSLESDRNSLESDRNSLESDRNSLESDQKIVSDFRMHGHTFWL
jgi:chromosome segregation ATPase